MSSPTTARQRELAPFVDLARETIAARLEGRDIRRPADLPDLPSQGVFVTLHTRADRALRGCIGHMRAVHHRLADEIEDCAIAAAFSDPRFPPVRRDELDGLEIELSLLEPEEPVPSRSDLDPRVWGITARSGFRRGVLLPDLDGVDTVEQQLAITLRKAGIRPDEDYELTRFRVTAVHEKPA